MKRIVVGADGSPGSMNALRWAGTLAAEQGAEVIVMTGFVPKDSDPRGTHSGASLAEQASELDKWCRNVDFGETPVRPMVMRGDPRPEILGVAAAEHADLIVVGREGASAGPGLLHIGSMAEWLAHHADQAVAVVGGAVNTSVRRAIVGVDGSDGSRAALVWVADLAQHSDIEIVVAAVTGDSVTWAASGDFDEWSVLVEDRIRTDWALPLAKREVPFSVYTSRGTNSADSLLEAARHERADIVVVGMRGIGGFPKLRIGGVALKVLHRADRPVVLVPPEHR
jgi:nucleotide-binding universal stress UspA family protein